MADREIDPRSEEMIAHMCKYCGYTREQYLAIVDGHEKHLEAGYESVARVLEKEALKKLEIQKQSEKDSPGYREWVAKKKKSTPKTTRR